MNTIPFDNTYARLPERFYARVNPTPVPFPRVIRVNGDLARELHLDPDWLRSPEGAAALSGNALLPGSAPLAQAYAGHQFGHFVPQLGDGRAILLGEIVDAAGRRRDLQLKGAGRTPFSRGGDGRAALGPALREYLLSEAMHALRIPTTRALAVVTTGEKVRRETFLDGAVFCRVAASHLRVGTFQFFAARGDVEALQILTHYALERHYPAAAAGVAPPAYILLENAIAAQAALIPRWMGIGFIHGVMNTDNCAISGDTIDFGPCAFMDTFHPRCVFSSIDHRSRYAWANQPGIAHWNLTRLAEALLPVLAPEEKEAIALAEKALSEFGPAFAANYRRVFTEKLGLYAPHDAFIERTLDLLAAQQVDFTLFFHHLTRAATHDLAQLFADRPALETWLTDWRTIAPTPDTAAMRRANPVLIPRNHRVEQAIQAAYSGDFSTFHRLADAWRHPYQQRPEFADLQAPPLPEEVVRETYCGT